AKQAALLGMRGIAFSTSVSEKKEPNFASLQTYVARALDLLIKEKEMRLINVNLPPKPKGIRWTRQAVGQYDGEVIRHKDPRGRPVLRFTVNPLEDEAERTFRGSCVNNWVSIPPSRLDLPAEKDLARALAFHTIPNNRGQEKAGPTFAQK